MPLSGGESSQSSGSRGSWRDFYPSLKSAGDLPAAATELLLLSQACRGVDHDGVLAADLLLRPNLHWQANSQQQRYWWTADILSSCWFSAHAPRLINLGSQRPLPGQHPGTWSSGPQRPLTAARTGSQRHQSKGEPGFRRPSVQWLDVASPDACAPAGLLPQVTRPSQANGHSQQAPRPAMRRASSPRAQHVAHRQACCACTRCTTLWQSSWH